MKNEYWYDLPERLIAQMPANPRDSSKLLVYDTKNNSLIIKKFSELAPSLPPSPTLTFNDAKVVPARVTLTKETGGKIVVLFLINEWISARSGPIPCFLDRKSREGDKLYFADKSFVTVQKQDEGIFYLSWDGKADDLLKKLDDFGTMPIPPYIKHSPLSRDELLDKYQTIFAKNPGSSAAPTASLHFTPEVFKSLEAAGIPQKYVTLHVGLGTFAPLTEQNIKEKKLHYEWYEMPEDTFRCIDKSKKEGGKIIAVGTTVVRTLESVANRSVIPAEAGIQSKMNQFGNCIDSRLRGNDNKISKRTIKDGVIFGSTDLFIQPPYEFKIVDGLITNFHLPGSSLMMLVDAFLEHKKAKRRILELYEFAKKNNFRFYSFGDAMLIV